MKRINFIFILTLTCLFQSCSNWYYCTVSGYGVTPQEKSYYIVPEDSSLDDDLEFQEYANILRQRLNEKGYIETDRKNADLCMFLSYYIGEERLSSTTTTTSSASILKTNSNTISNTIASANGSAKTNVYGNTVKTTGNVFGNSATNTGKNTNAISLSSSSSSSTSVYSTPIGCRIVAKSTKTQKKIWQVEVSDNMRSDEIATFRKLMPWMLASAQQYFGISGEGEVKITKKEGEARGLVFPYF